MRTQGRATGWDLAVAAPLCGTDPPTAAELSALRDLEEAG